MVNAVPEPVIAPVTFNVPLIVVLFDNLVVPDTFNDDTHVVTFDNVVLPETFNDDKNVEALLKLGIAGGLNILL